MIPLSTFLDDMGMLESGEALAAAHCLLASVEPALDPRGESECLWPWPDVKWDAVDEVGALECVRALIDIELARARTERALAG